MAKARSGGGITMSKNVSPPVRTGAARKGSTPASADYIGAATAFPKTPIESAPGYNTSVPLGNQKALDVQGGGAGKGREVFRSGSQNLHGSVNSGEGERDQGRTLDTMGRGKPVV